MSNVKYRLKSDCTYEEFLESNELLDGEHMVDDYAKIYTYEYEIDDTGYVWFDNGTSTYFYYSDIKSLSERVIIDDEIDKLYIGDHFDGDGKAPECVKDSYNKSTTANDDYASHYTGDDIEACEIQDMVSDILDGRIPAKQINMLWNIIKYVKRCGKKDDTIKEIVKIANYSHKMCTGEFIKDIGEIQAKLLEGRK